MLIFLFCPHLLEIFVTLTSSKLLSFENGKEKRVFFLHSPHLLVTLQTETNNLNKK